MAFFLCAKHSCQIFVYFVAPTSVIDCGTPPTIDNATPTTPTGTTFEATAVYACNENYELEDPSVDTLTCGATGTWDGPRPACGKQLCMIGFVDWICPALVTRLCPLFQPHGDKSKRSCCKGTTME